MSFEELKEWITQQRNKGISDSEIQNQLQAQGFNDQKINQAFQELQKILPTIEIVKGRQLTE